MAQKGRKTEDREKEKRETKGGEQKSICACANTKSAHGHTHK